MGNDFSKIGIYDLAGRNLKSILAKDNKHVLDVSDLRKGIYIVSVKNKWQIKNAKFIKE